MRQRRYGYMKMTAAVILSLSIQEPMLSHGATGTAEETKVEISMMEGSHSVETELQGTIEVSLISAALPSDVEFGVDPEGRFDARPIREARYRDHPPRNSGLGITQWFRCVWR